MKIVAGLGSVDDYIDYVKAGADECFCGYVPPEWNEVYGTTRPLNRREVRNYQVQIGAWEELKILRSMVECYGAPVQIALNALYYSGEQYKRIAELIERCCRIGFDTFIIADPALFVYLYEEKIPCRIQLSGEFSEINSLMLRGIAQREKYMTSCNEKADSYIGGVLDEKFPQVERVIFHRKNSIADMKSCIEKCSDCIPEYEAFFLNEMCHFSGAFCNSLHCDEMGYLCHVPYELGRYDRRQNTLTGVENVVDQERLRVGLEVQRQNSENDIENKACEEWANDGYITGASGCGLCALYDLADAGVTHLKLVGRGNYSEYMIRDIRQTRKALDILEETRSLGRDAYIRSMKDTLFAGACSHTCYYL